MSFFIIGLFVGLSLALTGSGGALLSIPLFMSFLEFTLKEATFYSLLVVAIASFLSVCFNLKSVNVKYALLMAIGSFIGSYVSNDMKKSFPDYVIISMLYLICSYSLFLIWKPRKNHLIQDYRVTRIWLLIFSGLLLGVLTTLTGLGGGVVLLPLLIRFFGFDESKAIGTSLMIILFSSGISFFIQYSHVMRRPHFIEVISIFFGVIIANILMKYLLGKLNQNVVFLLRRTLYSSIVIFTLFSLTFRR